MLIYTKINKQLLNECATLVSGMEALGTNILFQFAIILGQSSCT